jgi:hypothetical protein
MFRYFDFLEVIEGWHLAASVDVAAWHPQGELPRYRCATSIEETIVVVRPDAELVEIDQMRAHGGHNFRI